MTDAPANNLNSRRLSGGELKPSGEVVERVDDIVGGLAPALRGSRDGHGLLEISTRHVEQLLKAWVATQGIEVGVSHEVIVGFDNPHLRAVREQLERELW